MTCASLTILLLSSLSWAAPPSSALTFKALWAKVHQVSPAIRAAREDFRAQSISAKRAARHWYPRLSIDARTITTNDPTLSFMGLLNQRAIGASDFAPASLNEPGNPFFTRSSLALDFPVYEGGSGVAQERSQADSARARSYELRSAEIADYVAAAGHFGELISLRNHGALLNELRMVTDRVLARYQFRSRTNLLGRSGLLGLRTLKNRIDALTQEYAARAQSSRSALERLAGGLDPGWRVADIPLPKFLDQAMPLAENKSPSAGVLAATANADAIEASIRVERSRFLPRIGLYGEGDLYTGDRATATSYAVGAYLRWEVFQPTSFGAIAQAEASARAAEERRLSAVRAQAIGRQSGISLDRALARDRALILDSNELLREQTAITRDLFRTGSINALQFVEAFSRRLDLIMALQATEAQWIQTRGELFSVTRAEVPHGG